jgi:hypothetical protein
MTAKRRIVSSLQIVRTLETKRCHFIAQNLIQMIFFQVIYNRPARLRQYNPTPPSRHASFTLRRTGGILLSGRDVVEKAIESAELMQANGEEDRV